MNTINIIGNLTRDPEIRYLNNGTQLTKFTIAENSGNSKKTLFIECVCWDKLAENCSKYLLKGNKVGITGILESNEWEDKSTGEKKSKITIKAYAVDFLTPKNSNGGANNGQY